MRHRYRFLVLALATGFTVSVASNLPDSRVAASQIPDIAAPPPGKPLPGEPVMVRPTPPKPPPDFQAPPEVHPRHKSFDSAKARSDAQELARLAHGIPGDVDQVAKGVLPKDLSERLKQIQKLAKRLQGEISR